MPAKANFMNIPGAWLRDVRLYGWGLTGSTAA